VRHRPHLLQIPGSDLVRTVTEADFARSSRSGDTLLLTGKALGESSHDDRGTRARKGERKRRALHSPCAAELLERRGLSEEMA